MKKIKLAFLAIVALTVSASAQTKAAPWPEMKKFHSYMASTFHPAEEGNLKPLKEKSDSLFMAAKAWQNTAIPADYKPQETKETLAQLVKQTSEINDKVKSGAEDKELLVLITNAHDTFHKIMGECKKTDGHGAHDGHGH